MSVRIRHQGQEYIVLRCVGQDKTFNVESGETLSDDLHEHLVTHTKNRNLIPIIMLGWFLFLSVGGLISLIIQIVTGQYNVIDGFHIINFVMWGISLGFIGLIVFGLTMLERHLLRRNHAVRRDEYLWRRGYVTDKSSGRNSKTLYIDGVHTESLSYADYEVARRNDSYITVYILNKNKTGVSNIFAFCENLATLEEYRQKVRNI